LSISSCLNHHYKRRSWIERTLSLSGVLPRDFLQTHEQVPVDPSTNDAVATPAGHSAANLVSNQRRTRPRFPKQNIVMNSGVRFSDLAVHKFLTQVRN